MLAGPTREVVGSEEVGVSFSRCLCQETVWIEGQVDMPFQICSYTLPTTPLAAPASIASVSVKVLAESSDFSIL